MSRTVFQVLSMVFLSYPPLRFSIFNNEYREILQNGGLCLSGMSPDERLVETVELSDRKFYVGVQYHPEFKSRPNKPHPLFYGFISAAVYRDAENRDI